jgi:hypothetical protein
MGSWMGGQTCSPHTVFFVSQKENLNSDLHTSMKVMSFVYNSCGCKWEMSFSFLLLVSTLFDTFNVSCDVIFSFLLFCSHGRFRLEVEFSLYLLVTRSEHLKYLTLPTYR